MEAKHRFCAEMVSAVQPELLYDIGCNSGDYSLGALEAGAKSVVGFDFDQSVLEVAYRRCGSMLPTPARHKAGARPNARALPGVPSPMRCWRWPSSTTSQSAATCRSTWRPTGSWAMPRSG
jgi:hypothetical protein